MTQKKKSRVDKLIKGIIIGGAIGSVVGMTLAPKSGKQTREDIKNTATSIFWRKKKHPEAMKLGEPKKKKKGMVRTLLGGVLTLLFGKKNK